MICDTAVLVLCSKTSVAAAYTSGPNRVQSSQTRVAAVLQAEIKAKRSERSHSGCRLFLHMSSTMDLFILPRSNSFIVGICKPSSKMVWALILMDPGT